MMLLLLVPYTLPYFINPIFSQSPNNSQITVAHSIHADANVDNKPIFLPSSNSDHHMLPQTIPDNHMPPPSNPDHMQPAINFDHHAEGPKVENHEAIPGYNQEDEKKADDPSRNQGHQDHGLVPENNHSQNPENDYLTNDNPNPNDNNNKNNEYSEYYNDRNTYQVPNTEDFIPGQNLHQEEIRNEEIDSRPLPSPKKKDNEKEDDDSVVFVPARNNIETRREEPLRYRNVNDVMEGRNRKTLNDIVDARSVASFETEPPGEVVFVSGKNNDNNEKGPQVVKAEAHEEARRNMPQSKPPEIDCNNLNCNMNTKAVCGAKKEDNRWKYRVFKNQCFFRKVNCKFSYDYNRYMIQPLSKCKHLGKDLELAFNSRRYMGAVQFPAIKRTTTPEYPVLQNRRRIPYRRSMSHNLDGQTCNHGCPATCPEDYNPECAVDENGQARVFLNHCKLDYHSCQFNKRWYKRPLSDCVGDGKADVRNNRAFIGWMQRVGIVDGKGKLVFE